MNEPRRWLMVSESAWLAGLALVFGLPHHWTTAVLVVVVYLVLGLRRWSAAIMVLMMAAGIGVAVAVGPLTTDVVGALAVWRGFSLSRNDFVEIRMPFVWGVLASVGEFIARPEWAWAVLVVVVSASLIAMVPYGKRPFSQRIGFAFQLLGAGVVAGLAAAALIWLTPWKGLLHLLYLLVATPLSWLLRLIPFNKLKEKSKHALPTGKVSTPKYLPHQRPAAPTPHWVGPVLIILGLLAVAALGYWFYRFIKQRQQQTAPRMMEAGVIHEHIDTAADWFRNPFQPLPPVRAQVRRILHEANRRGHARREDETLREWAQTHQPGQVPAENLSLYDAVRYGNRPDTREDAERLKRSWPSWPPEESQRRRFGRKRPQADSPAP